MHVAVAQRGQVASSPLMLFGGTKAEHDALEQYVGLGVPSSRTNARYEVTITAGRSLAATSTGTACRQHVNGFFALSACLKASVSNVSGSEACG